MQDDDTDVVLRGVVSFVEKRKVERSKPQEEITKDVVIKAGDDDEKQNGLKKKKKKKAGKRKGKGKIKTY
ncbi:unnamed protein product [Thlaspi arvense]|uniref:Uncharacterized protein n=1 Tax=Thlaspi arvense TaxID=13288 RepID=A0AAU9RZJ2_THLAR|nr:unnamed protein product [Thlaspi arvense]